MTAPGSHTRRNWVRALVAVIVIGLLVVLGLNIYAVTSGTAAPQARPFTWDGQSRMSVVYSDTTPHTTGCVVTPARGEQRELRTPGARLARFANVPASTVKPWFDGSAQVVCPQGQVFTGVGAVAVEYRNHPAMLVIIAVFGLGILVRRGRQR